MSTAFLRTLAALGLSCTLAATPALAASPASDEAPQRFVHYGDLDLTTRAGQDALQPGDACRQRPVRPPRSGRFRADA
jgi:UrcA family protein